MATLKVGGVPEHFNLPWRLMLDARRDLSVEWRDFPAGTGAMVAALRDGSLDVAVVLTEGAVAARAEHGEFEILSTYTDSPLTWGIHVPAASQLRTEADVRGQRYAISRRGSGSHLMAFAHARRSGWPTTDLRFVEVGSLDGARAAFAEARADVFFWEKFMTKPLVDAKEFRRVGEFAADWPAFVVCVRREVSRVHGSSVLALIEDALAHADAFAASPDAPRLIAERFGLTPADAREWLQLTRWSREVSIDRAMLERVADVLADAGVIRSN